MSFVCWLLFIFPTFPFFYWFSWTFLWFPVVSAHFSLLFFGAMCSSFSLVFHKFSIAVHSCSWLVMFLQSILLIFLACCSQYCWVYTLLHCGMLLVGCWLDVGWMLVGCWLDVGWMLVGCWLDAVLVMRLQTDFSKNPKSEHVSFSGVVVLPLKGAHHSCGIMLVKEEKQNVWKRC